MKTEYNVPSVAHEHTAWGVWKHFIILWPDQAERIAQTADGKEM